MKYKLAAIFSVLTLALSVKAAVTADGAVSGEWTQDYDAAVSLAAEQGLPLLINFTGSDWCYWCKLMDSKVFSQEEWKTWAKGKIVLAFIDFPRTNTLVPKKYQARNRALAEKFGILGYPTYIVLASDGKTILGQLGASRDAAPAKFIADLEALLKHASVPTSL